MKKLFTLITVFAFTTCVFSQVPQKMSYQSVVRNASGVLQANQAVGIRISILQGSATGTPLYVETHSTATNSNGLVAIEIGGGTIVSGNLSGINWSASAYFIKTETDPTGGTNYSVTGTSQILSVPYAMHSETAETTDFNNLSNKPATLSGYGITDAVSVSGTQTITGNTTFKGTTPDMEAPLFEVKNKDGQTIFAVYNEGVRIWVADGAKGTKGGFAVGGFDMLQNYLDVSADRVRIYINDAAPGKGEEGGFAVGGFNMPTGNRSFLNVQIDTNGVISPSENRILWYPLKNAFLTGKVLIESKDSVGENSFASGYESKAAGDWSQALGYKAVARGYYSTAIGKNAKAYSLNSFAFGSNARALNEETYAFGSNSMSTGKGSVAIGFNSNATGWDAIAIGAGTQATGLGSFAVGFVGRDSSDVSTGSTIASQNYSVAIGMGAQSVNTYPSYKGAFSIGIQTISDGNYSFALGYRTRSSAWYSLATGYKTMATGNFSTAMGYESTSSGSHSVSIGQGALASNWYSIAIGLKTFAEGQQSMALGAETKAAGNFSVALGKLSKASGIGSVSIGYNNTASDYATATGYETIASGNYSFSSGFRTNASGSSSLAAGNQAVASGTSAIAMGSSVKATGDLSFASGSQTEASGITSTATGMLSVASGSYSLAGGYQTLASGAWSVALGQSCSATTWNTFAMGAASVANGYLGSAFGLMTKAKPFASFVIGQYNDSTCSASGQTQWVSTDPLFIAGNGTSPSQRSNAMTLYKDGNLTIAGNLTQLSDIRLKENILPFSGGASLIERITPVYFNFKKGDSYASGRQIGLIAQEIKEVIPELVYEDGRGILSIDYSKMSVVLLQALKEQHQQIESYKSQVQSLQEKVDRIEALLSKK